MPPCVFFTPRTVIFNTCFRRKSRKVKQKSKSTFRQSDQERKIGPNPTHYSKFDKTKSGKNQHNEIVRKLVILVFFLYLSIPSDVVTPYFACVAGTGESNRLSLSSSGGVQMSDVNEDNRQKEKAKIREIEIPNNSRILGFTIYLPNLVYWVGFVTGITFTTHL